MMKEIRIIRTSKSCSPSLQTASLCSSLHSSGLQCKERNQSMFSGALASPRKWSLRVINYSELTCRTSLTRVDIYYSLQPPPLHSVLISQDWLGAVLKSKIVSHSYFVVQLAVCSGCSAAVWLTGTAGSVTSRLSLSPCDSLTGCLQIIEIIEIR